METKEQLISNIKEWIKLDTEIAQFKKDIKDRNNRKKLLTENLVTTMKSNSIDCFDINGGALIYKKNKTELSPRAEQLRHNLVVYGSRYENDDNGLSNALSNERKPSSDGYDSATKIVNYMRKSELKSPLELKTVLCKKWEDIG